MRRECTALLFAITVSSPALARTYLDCATKEVVIVSGPSDESYSTKEANMGFWIDDEAKTVTLADGTRLMVTRLDGNWLSASRGDISYEFNRRNGILSYAASTTKGRVTTVIIGSGRCESNPAPPR